jgi:hypothetical protein
VTGRRAPLPAVLAVALLAVGVVLGGCGEQRPERAADSPAGSVVGGTGPEDTGTEPPGHDPGGVVSVTVRRTGGLAGVDETTTVHAGSPGARRVLDLVDGLPAAPAPVPKQAPCCDRITYRVSVRFADGGAAAYVTWDGDSGPVLALVASVMRGGGGGSGSSWATLGARATGGGS